MKINFVAFPLEKNLKAQAELIEKYGNYSPEEADFIVALGGDGFILKSLHDFLKINFVVSIKCQGVREGTMDRIFNF